MSVLPFFGWVQSLAVGESIRNSLWLFPAIESLHLLGLAVISGSILLVDMRLFGLGMRNQSVRQIARDAEPWFVTGLIWMLLSGSLLFTSEAIKCYRHWAFWLKMACLFLAIIFTFTIRRRVTMADAATITPFKSRLVAIASLVLWSGVGFGGRWIGFS